MEVATIMEICQKFMLDGKVIAENSYTANIYTNRFPFFKYSTANFCPNCGQVWSRIIRNKFNWAVNTISCSKCESIRDIRSIYPIAGSFYDVTQASNQVDTWPNEIIEHEFNLLLDLLEFMMKKEEDFNGF